MKKIYLTIIFIFLSQCGYTSLYKDAGKVDINITVEKIEGDNYINNLIRTQLQSYKSENTKEIFVVSIKTEFSKSTVTKDKSGNTSVLLLSAKTLFEVKFNGKEYKYFFEEDLNVNKSSNSNEESKYEDIVKKNFAETIKNKLILRLIELK